MKRILDRIDPYRQSFLYFKWGFWSLLFCVVAVVWLWQSKEGSFVSGLLSNRFVYLPNYLIHEMLGHNFIGNIGWRLCYGFSQGLGQWWMALMGDGTELLVTGGICLGLLQLQGGRFLLPFSMYWLSTCLYGAAIYAADARAMKMALTSSDMMTNYAPGEIKGDWWYILKPLGLLEYDTVISSIFMLCALTCVVLAALSLWYYWTHMEQYWNNQ